MKNTVIVLLGAALAVVLGLYAWMWLGIYDMGADSQHWRMTVSMLTMMRERSIEKHAASITVPGDINDPKLILKGAGQYAAMCAGCHLAPGVSDSEIRPGLYPQPPNLSQVRVDPRQAFWVIKHGIKMSAMPAWGFSHDDATLWSMVAFLQKLPGMTPAEYQAIVSRAPPDDDMGPMDHGPMTGAQAPAASGPPAPGHTGMAALPGMSMPAAGASAPAGADRIHAHDH
jgi:mono/diheme cytochrome c family protein